MINVDSHSFNNNVADQINKIKTALTKITPDNIKYFDDTLLRKARGVVNAVDEYKWSSNSVINSVPVKSIQRMTDFLKISSMEYVVLASNELKLMSDFGINDKWTLCFSYKYNVPFGFDGRNSFVKHILVENVTTSNTAFPQYFEDMVYIMNSSSASLSINKSSASISIEGSIPSERKYIDGDLKSSEKGMYITILCWRKK